MFILTGSNGFIGYNLYQKIKSKYQEKIIIIDDLKKNKKNRIHDEEIIDFRDIDELKFNCYINFVRITK